jgi:hypothetical protein
MIQPVPLSTLIDTLGLPVPLFLSPKQAAGEQLA